MSAGGDGPPARVRVTSPRAGVRRAHRPAATEIDAQTELGAIYMRSLLWAQARLAAGILLLLALLIGGLPLLFWLAPTLLERSLFGMPLAWSLLGFAVYPVLLALGWVYVRRAERNERSFTDLVDEP